MRVSINWLKEYVDVDAPVDKLADMLNLSGTKVEAIHRPGSAIHGVVVAEVLAIAEHPNADNLTLVDVSVGNETARVVCGARNFSVGDRVPYARVGAALPEMQISERKIRGEASAGMLCSAAELGISKDHSGILVLGRDATLGDDVVRVLGLDDTILELEVTPNRPDCMGMIGVAREVAALLQTELKLPSPDFRASDEVSSDVVVEIRDTAGCPRYLARYVEGLKVAPSPQRMAARLLAAGVRPISNVVDATNYVLLETGHPLHAFDATKVEDRHIVVRRAARGETFTTLDGIERSLESNDLLIADPRRALAIAGVMGGLDSEVSDDTAAVILESAYFDPASIGATGRRLGLRTEASARFERGADPEVVPYAAARAVALMTEHAGGSAAAAAVDEYPQPIPRRRVTLRARTTDALLGYETPAPRQAAYLRSVGFVVTESDGALDVEVPGFRPDVSLDVDLIEEVARLAGFERLPSTLPPGVAGGLDAAQSADRRVHRSLAATGMSEVWTTAFGSPDDFDALSLGSSHPSRRSVAVANPMLEDERILRTTMIPGLLRAVARNVAHRATNLAFFEIARVYEPTGDRLPREATLLAGVCCGDREVPGWQGRSAPWDFFAVKGALDRALEASGWPALEYSAAAGAPFHPTRAAVVSLEEAKLGAIGELHPQVCETFEVPEGCVAFEIALAPLVSRPPGRAAVEELPRYPAAHIDIALVVDDAVPAGTLLELVRSAGAPEVASVRLFDLYRGPQVPQGKKSLAFALELRSPSKTLTDEEALGIRDRIVAAAAERYGAELRTLR